MLAIFFISLIISFIGSLPFGSDQFGDDRYDFKNSLRTSFWFALAAAMVEMGQSLAALQGSSWLAHLIEHSPWMKIVGFVFFLIIGMLFFFKRTREETRVITNTKQQSFFLKGFLVAILNPQAIPFWVIMLTLLPSTSVIRISSQSHVIDILSFIIGASFGKLGALLLFGILSERIISRSALIRNHINRIIGIILISIGMFQGILAIVG